MGRVYATVFENVAVAGLADSPAGSTQDFFEIAPADDKPCRLLSLELSQNTETGDAAEEFLRVKVIRGHATVGSGGGTDNESPVLPADAAAGYVGGINNTTIASTGTPVDLWVGNFNVRVGLEKVWTPETALVCSQAEGTMVVRLMAAPADSVTMSGTMYVEELA